MSTATTIATRAMAENVYQVRLPLPFALNHVNCYLLRDSDGWTLVDTGLNQPACVAGWLAAWAELGITPAKIHRVILTHMHPDHFGLSGWVQQSCGAPVYLSPRERAAAEITWVHDEPTETRRRAVGEYMRSGGIGPEVASMIGRQQERLRSLTLPSPTSMDTIAPGATLCMGGRSFVAIHAPGHADGQLLFYAAEDGLLLCGDQVLLNITPNIGVWPTSRPNPLADYLASLRELMDLKVSVGLPGHHGPITDWRGRLAALVQHHDARLAAMYDAAQGGASALEVSYAVFNYDRFSPHEVRFAVAETLAHLEYLAVQGRLVRIEEPDRRIYRAA